LGENGGEWLDFVEREERKWKREVRKGKSEKGEGRRERRKEGRENGKEISKKDAGRGHEGNLNYSPARHRQDWFEQAITSPPAHVQLTEDDSSGVLFTQCLTASSSHTQSIEGAGKAV
jgi:hypothetical protein